MQRLADGSLRFSPRDLISYLEGDYAAWCDRRYAERSPNDEATSAITPDARDAEMELAARRGTEHELAHLASLKILHADLVEIAPDDDAHTNTHLAMVNGAPVIYQGELRSGAWRGITDFLHRREGISNFGSHYYEPRDTKLARSPKPYFFLQLSHYAELLEGIQGRRPEELGFVLGDGKELSFRLDDFWYYYRRTKHRFETFHADWKADQQPDPALERSFGRWAERAERELRARDDLTLVAGITRSQRVLLRNAGIDTVARLATSTVAVPRMTERTLANLREQAAMQMQSRTQASIAWKHRDIDTDRPRRGFALLPPESPDDVFFDIEGFPYAARGLEYLLGVVTVDTGAPVFHDWWAHDDDEERTAFESFIDWVHLRWTRNPSMHVYHYAAYEKSAINRLVGKYSTRDREVRELLSNEVFVDLYTVTRQALVIGTESYSLKYVEHLYMPHRTGDVTSAGGSVVEYQRWIDSGESPDPAQSPILGAIRDYNRIDCESTAGLRDWLVERQRESGVAWLPMPVEEPSNSPQALKSAELNESLASLAQGMLARGAAAHDAEERRIATLVGNLMEFHRRCDAPEWREYFERMKATDDVLFQDRKCLAGLERSDTPPRAIRVLLRPRAGALHRGRPRENELDRSRDAGARNLRVRDRQHARRGRAEGRSWKVAPATRIARTASGSHRRSTQESHASVR